MTSETSKQVKETIEFFKSVRRCHTISLAHGDGIMVQGHDHIFINGKRIEIEPYYQEFNDPKPGEQKLCIEGAKLMGEKFEAFAMKADQPIEDLNKNWFENNIRIKYIADQPDEAGNGGKCKSHDTEAIRHYIFEMMLIKCFETKQVPNGNGYKTYVIVDYPFEV